MADPPELLPAREERVDVGWRGSALPPAKKRLIEVVGVAGARTAAERLQKEEELRLGIASVDAKALRDLRRAGQGSVSLGKSNAGVDARNQRDKAAILTEDDREAILEKKARTYDALRSGQQFDDSGSYHVEFQGGGQLDSEPSTSRQTPSWLTASPSDTWQGSLRAGDMVSKDMQREQQRQDWEMGEQQAYEEELQRELARDAKVEGIREQERQTKADRKRIAKQKQAAAAAEASNKKKTEDFVRDALRRGLLPKRRLPP